MLITFCGIDGSGKTTHIKKLNEYLISLNRDTYLTKQPTDWYRNDEKFRDFSEGKSELDMISMKGLALFSAADKMRHMAMEVIPNLKKNNIVISDRYVYSAYAYFLERGISDINWLKSINDAIIEPDIVFYLDVSADVAYKRILERDGSSAKKEEKDVVFLERVRSNFLNQPWGKSDNYYIINSNESDEITSMKIREIVLKYI